jgi:hypothetical protein
MTISSDPTVEGIPKNAKAELMKLPMSEPPVGAADSTAEMSMAFCSRGYRAVRPTPSTTPAMIRASSIIRLCLG